MTWVAIDDKFPDHPKVAEVPRELRASAMWLHTSALCFCSRHLTDGFIPTGKLGDLYTLGDHDPEALAKALRKARMWVKVRGGWQIHDYADYQPTREEVEKKRGADHEAKVRAGKARAASAIRTQGGTFARKTAGESQQNQRDDQQQASSPRAADQPPTPTPTPTQAPEPIGQTPVSSRSSEPQRKERGSYPQARLEPHDQAYFAGKVGRMLRSDEVRSLVRIVAMAKGDKAMVSAAIEETGERGFGFNLGYIHGCVSRWMDRSQAVTA